MRGWLGLSLISDTIAENSANGNILPRTERERQFRCRIIIPAELIRNCRPGENPSLHLLVIIRQSLQLHHIQLQSQIRHLAEQTIPVRGHLLQFLSQPVGFLGLLHHVAKEDLVLLLHLGGLL